MAAITERAPAPPRRRLMSLLRRTPVSLRIGAVILLVLTMISEKKHHAEIAAKRG